MTDTYHGKTVLKVAERPAFAELAILWTLRDAGWDGIWIDWYRGKYRTDYWDASPVELAEEPAKLLERIYALLGSRSGAWDIFCWRGGEVLFTEAKRRGHDCVRALQLSFLDAALAAGLSIQSFLIVEWTLRE